MDTISAFSRKFARAALPLLVAGAAAPVSGQGPAQEWVALRYEATLLDDGSSAWQGASVETGVRRARATGLARLNFASRFGQEALQLEADLYPAWPGLGYAHLTGAWSAGVPFPDLRAGAELFAVLPRAYEASAGATWMDFGGSDVAIWTLSLSKYAGDYWFSVRPHWLPARDDFAITLAARRYLGDADSFVTLRLVRGSAPETLETVHDVGRARSLTMQTDAQLGIAPRWRLLPLVSVTSEELSGGRERLRVTGGVGGMFIL